MKIPLSVRSKYPVLLVASLGGLFTVVNLASAQTWTPTSAPFEYWGTVASSADGSKLVATGGTGGAVCRDYSSPPVPIYTSTDSGATWTQTSAPSNHWSSVASSADGSKLVATGGTDCFHRYPPGPIYTSADSGATWTKTSAPSNFWSSVASSADGTKLVAVASDDGSDFDAPIYTSADSGETWTQANVLIGRWRPDWTSVASSADGTRLVAVGSNGGIHTSMNSGATWTEANALGESWKAVASSADGTKLVAAALPRTDEGSRIYTSADAGATWTPTGAPSRNWYCVASSADGSKLVAGGNLWGSGNGLFNSTNSGATWTMTSSGQGLWISVASSADGNRLVATSIFGSRPRGYIYIGPYSGPWRLTSAPTANWTSVASSADGVKVVAATTGTYSNGVLISGGAIYSSTNSGATWTQIISPTTNYWTSVASSADGTKLVAATTLTYSNGALIGGGAIYNSANSGVTWTQTSAPINSWLFVASSADGTKLVAVTGSYGPIYTSMNSGVTWTQTTAPDNIWSSVASSADGTKLVAVASYDGSDFGGPIYTSTNSGATWTQTSAPSNNWTSVASSADGAKLVAAAPGTYFNGVLISGGAIYTSANSGVTWTQTSVPSFPWYAVASSAEGSKLVAVDQVGHIYTSPDSGATWMQAGAPGESWAAVASSADGNKLVATAGGPIYTLQFPTPPPPPPPSPLLSISPSGGSLDISWIVPSTSFVLQQNFDLATTNWTDVPTLPSLNSTNLHYEVPVSLSPGNRFYRLKQQ